MARTCTLCVHAKREEIDCALIGGTPLRDIAGQFGVSRTSLSRHRKEHLSSRMAEAAERDQEADVAMALDVVGELRRVNDAARTVLTNAQEAGDGGLTLQATDRILKQVETQARLIGLINDGNVVQVRVGTDWPSLRALLIRALVPYPEARLAVLEALEGA